METLLLICLVLGVACSLVILFLLYLSVRRQEIILESIELNSPKAVSADRLAPPPDPPSFKRTANFTGSR